MYYAPYRNASTDAWRFSESRSVQPAASDRSTQGGETLSRANRRLRTPSLPRLRA
jgi:hypothetical protein